MTLQTLDSVWQVVTDRNYKILSVIGEGAFGVVVRAKSSLTKKIVAIKHIQVEQDSQYSLVKVLRELKISQFLNGHETRTADMQKYFASMQDLFCPPEELE